MFGKLWLMQQTAVTSSSPERGTSERFFTRVKYQALDLPSVGAALLSSFLLILAFPDFDLWPLAWIALLPLLLAIARKPSGPRAFMLGWLSGTVFFYCSCYWLTFSMIHYGGLPVWLAYLLLFPGALVVGVFPALFAFTLSLAISRYRQYALLLAPIFWVAFEWARLGVTGQLWNALGYSQAYQPWLIQAANWGGVYAVSFLIVTINAAVAFLIINRSKRSIIVAASGVIAVIVVVFLSPIHAEQETSVAGRVVALQPNVPMALIKSAEEMRELTARHITMSEEGLGRLPHDTTPVLVIWPESPMNFTYAGDAQFREFISSFAREHGTSLLFNSQEPAPNNGIYNSAVLINRDGSMVGQYDKIRLLPFGEYVPLPRWLPGANLITAIVGDFSPGVNYTLLPAGEAKAGVFICIESAYPSIARRFTEDGAEVLINISNDGYLGRTAVLRQHLANAIFRATENRRPLLRVTNTGITAFITKNGKVVDATDVFEPAVRVWDVKHNSSDRTFYTRHGDLFALSCAVVTLIVFTLALLARGKAQRSRISENA
ncbi:MAG TPA: apolipoprotein N-acyltransferase [Pyrinomonadaceae bacterium]|nr:apolipoprotein N-acyltransferase [Pyrinomonadaceae bacterium]